MQTSTYGVITILCITELKIPRVNLTFSDLLAYLVTSRCRTDKTNNRRRPKKSWNIAGLQRDTMAVLLHVIRPFLLIFFIYYYVKLRLLLFNIGFLTLLLVQTCTVSP